jgi:hypothetical protein
VYSAAARGQKIKMTVKNLKRKGRQGPAPVHEDTGPLLRFRSQQEIQRSVTFLVASLTLSIAGIIGLRVLGDKFMPQGGMPLAAVTTYDPATERMSLQHGWVAPSVNSTYGTDSLDFSPVEGTLAPQRAAGVLWLDVRPGYQPPNLNLGYQLAAMAYIAKNEGCDPKTYLCPAGLTTIGIGTNISADPTLFTRVLNCDPNTAAQLAKRLVTAELSPQAVEYLFKANFASIHKIVAQKCANRGVDFNTLPPRAQIALLDIGYIRPDWADKVIPHFKVGNFKAAGYEVAQIANAYANSKNQRGVGIRLAKAAWLIHNATQNRGMPDSLKIPLSPQEIQSLSELAPTGLNPVIAPLDKKQNDNRHGNISKAR